MAKVTFSADDATIRTLRTTAERLKKSQSLVFREAIAEYAARAGRLTDAEQRHMLAAIDRMLQRPITRSAVEVKREVHAIRRARRHGGRRNPAG
jgi:predicted transcriptional regulator